MEPPIELTYASSGVDILASEAATKALIDSIGGIDQNSFAGMLDIGDSYLAVSTDGVGTKILVAEYLSDYSTIGIDCIAMNVNDLIAAGIKPLAFVDYLAMGTPNKEISRQIGIGLSLGIQEASITLLGGETAIIPDIVSGVDLAGTCVGISPKKDVFSSKSKPGDVLVGWGSSGLHSNGYTLARKAILANFEYSHHLTNSTRTIGELLLEPTRIYSDLLPFLQGQKVNAAAHITGGGWSNIKRMGDSLNYVINNPLKCNSIFDFIQESGNISDKEMYNTFNMGLGFVASLPEENASNLSKSTGGTIIGHVTSGSGKILFNNMSI